jgi:hypothetical protein
MEAARCRHRSRTDAVTGPPIDTSGEESANEPRPDTPDTPDIPDTPAPASDVCQGQRLDGADARTLAQSMTGIVAFRGDVTITRRDGAAVVGYVFECTDHDDPAAAVVRLLPESGGGPIAITLADILAIDVTGRDTAEGKSFERWIKRYAAKKLAGEDASIY